MAVSGRKQTGKQGSIAGGSAEDLDNKCEPCLTIGQHIEAHGFCVPCQEYLCKTCEDCHKRTKALRNHQILCKDEFDKIQNTRKSYNECTEQCPLHQKEVIKFYCPKHAYLGCTECITIDHRTCKIDYIPEKCAGIADSKEYKDIMMKLSEKLKDAEEISKKAGSRSSDINDVNKEVIKTIEDFRVEINDRLDQMQQDILKRAEEKQSNNISIVKGVIDTCGNIISHVKILQSSLRANKTNNQNGQIYIDIKRAESTLKSDDLREAKEKLMNMNLKYAFRRNADLKIFLLKEIDFGDLINHQQPETTKKKNTIDQMTIKSVVNVKTKSDKENCYITGCAVLSSNQLILADYNNKKVKVVSLENKCVLGEKVLDSKPLDVAVMSDSQFAVTMSDKKRIDVITTYDKLSLVASINVDGNCYGIAFHQDRLYVACVSPCVVLELNTHGSVLNKIPLNSLGSFSFPFITVRKDSNLLYISDLFDESVFSVSLQGDISATYKHENLYRPRGMCVLDSGSLLLCCFNGTIHQVKGDLKEGMIMSKDIANPMSICYSARNDEVYVGCSGDKLKVMTTK